MAVAQRGKGEGVKTVDKGRGGPGGSGRLGIKGGRTRRTRWRKNNFEKITRNSRQYLSLKIKIVL